MFVVGSDQSEFLETSLPFREIWNAVTPKIGQTVILSHSQQQYQPALYKKTIRSQNSIPGQHAHTDCQHMRQSSQGCNYLELNEASILSKAV